MVHRNNAGRLGAGFISVCLETGWLGHFGGFYVPEPYCKVNLGSQFTSGSESVHWQETLNPLERGRCSKLKPESLVPQKRCRQGGPSGALDTVAPMRQCRVTADRQQRMDSNRVQVASVCCQTAPSLVPPETQAVDLETRALASVRWEEDGGTM